ncbi:jhy protein homolog [Erpetoichthys calabaricus]|uniref:Junctional cadherin complex regulator n=1 Tax=Erpetoichthys calabaricus TaxID=27687 RepID=A0A8C4TDD7_ERPCA|nr:jhy protein homolog [Erpetoichthys calabaricus]
MDKISPTNRKKIIEPGAPYTRLPEVPESPPSLEDDLHLSLRDSLESDTESLAQERKYQFDLQRRIHQTEKLVYRDEPSDHSKNEVEYGNDDNEEDNDNYSIYDSLEEPTLSYLPGDIPAYKENELMQLDDNKESRSQDDDKYASLRYNPDWRNNLDGASGFATDGLSVVEDFSGDSLGESLDVPHDSPRKPWVEDSEGRTLRIHTPAPSKGSASFSISKNKQNVETTPKLPPTPYYPQYRENMNKNKSGDPAAGLSWNFQNADVENVRPYKEFNKQSSLNKEIKWSSGLEEETDEPLDYQYEGELNFSNVKSTTAGKTVTPVKSHEGKNSNNRQFKENRSKKVSQKPARPAEDFVEKNKFTLGVNSEKKGSYLRYHSRKKEASVQQQVSTVEEKDDDSETYSISSHEGQNEALVPELRWMQRTQKLKTHKSKQLVARKRGEQDSSRKPPLPPDSKTQRSNKQNGVLEIPLQDRRHNVSFNGCLHSDHQNSEVLVLDDLNSSRSSNLDSSGNSMVSTLHGAKVKSFKQKAPTVNLNINFDGADMQPYVIQDQQKTIINLKSPQSLSSKAVYWSPRTNHDSSFGKYPTGQDVMAASYALQYPRPLLTALPASQVPYDELLAHQKHASLMHPQRIADDRFGMELITYDKRMDLNRQRFSPLSHMQSSNQQFGKLSQQNQWQPSGHPEQKVKMYTVLPPIAHTSGSDSNLNERTSERSVSNLQRSSSEGYLAQMEKQKQLRHKVTYKPYTLADYANLQQEVKLGGLGPNCMISDEKAEKMKQQKEYSKQIREQNQKMKRSSMAPAANTENKQEKKNTVRDKALEYAKNIRKPKPPVQTRSTNEKPTREAFSDHVQYLEDLDLSHLATLEMLQRRHEAEKQVVAGFKVLNVG